METPLSKALSEIQWCKDKTQSEEVIGILVASIAEMLEKEPDLLLSSMYRMDINEGKILQILQSHKEKDIPTALAELVLERQKVSLSTRAKYPQKKINDPEASF